MTENKITLDETLEEMENSYMSEDELIKNILEAANFENDEDLWREIEIARNGKVLFSFRVRPLTGEELERSKKEGRKYTKARGRKVLDDIDEQAIRAWIIYTATVDEDKAKIWDNDRVKRSLNCLHGTDVVQETLRPGEINAIVDVLDEISGYDVDFQQESFDKIKN